MLRAESYESCGRRETVLGVEGSHAEFNRGCLGAELHQHPQFVTCVQGAARSLDLSDGSLQRSRYADSWCRVLRFPEIVDTR